MGRNDPPSDADSAGVDFVACDRLVSIDVLGGLDSHEAQAAAIDLATSDRPA